MANPTLSEKVEAIYKNPTMLANAKDYLNMLAESEGTANQGDNGYNIMFRGGKIADYKAHPNQRHEYIDKQGRKGISTAAGRYQFIHSTYQETAKKLGITDFSPESQDKVAIALMLERGVDFNDGADLATNVNKINNTWTSLTGSTVGAQYHSQRDPQFLLNAFNKSRTARGASPVTTKWGNTTYQSPANVGAPANIQQLMAESRSYLESLGLPKGGLLGETVRNIRNKTYADSSYIPWQMYRGNKFTVSSNPYLTESNLASMDQRLHNTDPSAEYGVSSFGDGLHPIVAIQQPNGTVAIGTDVSTTISPAPALSDGGVPVEDAVLRAQHEDADRAYLLRPSGTTAIDPDYIDFRQVPQQTPVAVTRPATNNQPATTAPVSKTVASDASASTATTPLANNTGASQPTAPVTTATSTAPVAPELPKQPDAIPAPYSNKDFLADNMGLESWDAMQETTPQVLQVGGFQIPWASSNQTDMTVDVPLFPWLTPDGAKSMLQSISIKSQDMPQAPVKS